MNSYLCLLKVIENRRNNRERGKKSTHLGASAGPDAIYKSKCVYFRGKTRQDQPEKEMKCYADKVACPITQLKSFKTELKLRING